MNSLDPRLLLSQARLQHRVEKGEDSEPEAQSTTTAISTNSSVAQLSSSEEEKPRFVAKRVKSYSSQSSPKKVSSHIIQANVSFLDHYHLYKMIRKQTEDQSDLYPLMVQLKKDGHLQVKEFALSLRFPEEACIKESDIALTGNRCLDTKDPMFSKLNGWIESGKKLQDKISREGIPKTLERLKAVIEFYESYLLRVCQTTGDARVSLLIGKARLYINGECYLISQEAGRKITSLNPYGMTNCNNAYGAAAVAHVGTVYYKRPRKNPIRPGEDFAVHALHQLLCHRKTLTPTHLLKVENIWISSRKDFKTVDIENKYRAFELEMTERYQGQWDPFNQPGFIQEKIFEHYPEFMKECSLLRQREKHHLLTSAGVDGKPLTEYLKNNLATISFANFTPLCFLSLLILPTDWRSDNFIVCPIKGSYKYDIIGIDNDGILTPGILVHKNDHSLALKSSLFLLPQMRETLDQKFIEFFLSLDPAEGMLEWLSKLRAEEKKCLGLLDQGIFTQGHYRELSLPLKVAPQAFISCYKRWKKIQAFVKEHPKATHLDLMENLFPAIAKIYDALLKKTNFDVSIAEKLLFRLWVESGLEIEMIFEELIDQPVQNEIHDFCWVGSKEGMDSCSKKFIEEIFPLLDEHEQVRFLKNIFHYFPDLQELTLKDCLLRDADLLRCLSNHPLKMLVLESALVITKSSLICLLEHQPDLHLVIGNCPKISGSGLVELYEACRKKNQIISLSLKGQHLVLEKHRIQELLTLCLEDEKIKYAASLVRLGAELTAVSSNKQTLMHKLAGKKCIHTLNFLITQGMKVNDSDAQGQTPLHLAAQEGQIENVTLFLKQGADINCQDNQGRTPLYFAVLKGHYEMTQFLIGNQADISIREKNEQQTVLHVAAFYGHIEIVALLLRVNKELLHLKDNDGKNALHQAVRSVHPDHHQLVKYLIEQGSDPNTENRFKYTPLHFAAQNGYLECTKILIAHGAKKETYNVQGDDRGQPTSTPKDTPIDLAARYYRDEVLFLLLYPEKKLTVVSDGFPKQIQKKYFKLLEYAQNNGDVIEQIFYLNRISDLYMPQEKKRAKDFLAAAKFANAAVSLGLSTKNPQLIEALMIRLEKVEAEYLFSIGIKSSPSNRTYLKNFAIEFQKARATLELELKKQGNVRKVVQNFTLSTKTLLIQAIDHAIEQMRTTPPCKYALLARGDLAKGELLPHSDIQLMVLLSEKNESNEKYFKSLCKLIDLKLMNLGLNRGSIFAKEDAPIRSAFCLYSHEANDRTGVCELIATPQDMAEHLTLFNDKKTFSFHTLCTTSLVTGDKELCTAYHKKLSQVMTTTLKESLGNDLLAESLRKFHLHFFVCSENRIIFNIKKELYEPMQGMIEALIFTFDLPQQTITTEDRIRRLGKLTIFSKDSIDYLLQMYDNILKLRLDAHLTNISEKDSIFDECHNQKLVKEAYQLVYALFKRMNEFYLQKNKTVFKDFGLQFNDGDRVVVQKRFVDSSEQALLSVDPYLLISAGLQLQKSHDYEHAIQNYSTARKMYELSYGSQSPLVGAICHLLGNAMVLARNYEQAFENYAIDVKITEAFLGKKHLEIGFVYQKMASCKFYLGLDFQNQEKWADALACYEKALQLCPEEQEENAPLLAEINTNICVSSERYGALLAELEQYSEALKKLETALSLLKGQISEEDPRITKLESLIDYCKNRIQGD